LTALDLPAEKHAVLERTLSLDEKQRASHIRFSLDRGRWVKSRGLLRIILSQYLGLRPNEISFTDDQLDIEDFNHGSQLFFSLSHTQGWAIYAVAANCRIGVDIEVMEALPELEPIIQRYYSDREAKWLRSLPDSERLLWFYRIWTGKEAVLKAVRKGITQDLRKVEIGLDVDQKPQVLNIEDVSSGWSLQLLSPAENVVGMLAVPGSMRPFRYWQLD